MSSSASLNFSDKNYKNYSGAHQPHALIIGSGLGGLAAAVRLGARGYRVTILERLDAPGGRAYVHHQDGFSFDAGPTIITAPFLLEELWRLGGRNFSDEIDLRRMDPFYQIRFSDGQVFDYSDNYEAIHTQIARLSPRDIDGYSQFMRRSETVFKLGFEQLAHIPFRSWLDMARIVPSMIRLESYRSVYSIVSQFIKNPLLRQAFSFHPLLIGGNPFSVTSIYILISFLERKWGVHSVMGGTGALVRGLVSLIEGQGGTLRYQAEVAEILVRDQHAVGVRLTSGEEIPAQIVISNADAATTYLKLLSRHPRRRWTNQRLTRADYSNGLFVWYFGTRCQYPAVKHHTILLGPRYQGLIQDIFKYRRLAEDFSLYLHRPTATDPSVAPPGCDTFYALAPVPHLGGEIDWSQIAESYRTKIAKLLEDTLLPDLQKQIATSLIATPLDFQNRLSSYLGAGFSLEPTFTQSAWFRPHNQSEEVAGLYLVGAGTHPGAGVPGVLSSARVLDLIVPNASEFN